MVESNEPSLALNTQLTLLSLSKHLWKRDLKTKRKPKKIKEIKYSQDKTIIEGKI